MSVVASAASRLRRARGAVAAAAVAAVGLSGCGFTGLYGWNLPGGANVGSHPYTVTVQFANVLDLVPQSSVKVNDVAVGKVTSIKLDGWIAEVKLSVNRSVHLPANARASVQMTSLLGEKYVDLEQPTVQPSTQPLTDGSVIPLSSTTTAPEVEQVLGALSLLLNGGGLQQIRVITTELNDALHGHEDQIRDLLGRLNSFVGQLDTNKNAITTALENIDKLAASLNAQKQTIVDTLNTLPQALQVLSDERGKLVTLLQSLARLGSTATQVINATQQTFTTTLRSLAPVLEQLTAAGDQLPQALGILLTYPFPVGTTENIIKGDYANLDLYLNADIGKNLCGLLNIPQLCPSATATATKTAAVTTTSAAGPVSGSSSAGQPARLTQLPAFPGSGG